MIIKVLAENTSSMANLGCEHGLSLYIKTKNTKVLFDTGASNLFFENAEKMKVELSKIDIAVLSHGHNDHGGGLKKFLELNSQAKIYVQEKAFGDYYAQRPNNEKKYIGLDRSLLTTKRFVFVGDRFKIDDELELFSAVKQEQLSPSGNKSLFRKQEQEYVLDDFEHEQNLVIKEDGNLVLLAGCSHNGIVNILAKFNEIYGRMPTHVIAGMHLYNPALDENEDVGKIRRISAFLLASKARFYTCHCTGLIPYIQLEELMGASKLSYLSTGNQLII